MPDRLSYIFDITQLLMTAIKHHKVFSALTSIERFRRFTEMHVYATWDFMCLLKALHRKLNDSSELLWLPPIRNYGDWLINPRLALEENDITPTGDYLSHFELYLQAMDKCGANTRGINTFIRYVERDPPISLLLAQNYLSETTRRYLTDTFDMIDKDSHVLAACFAFAREHLAENMFTQILQHLAPMAAVHSNSLALFIGYFQRQIDLTSQFQRWRAEFLLTTLCDKDEVKWEEAAEAAVLSLKSQFQLLDGIYAYMTG